MLKTKPYRSANYPTPEHAQRIADNLSKIDGNKYIVYSEVVNGEASFHFDNVASLAIDTSLINKTSKPDITTVADIISFLTDERRALLDYVTPSERTAIKPLYNGLGATQ